MASPALTVVTGRPGTGKTTLAHSLAREIGCPAIVHDEITQGMVLTNSPTRTAGVGEAFERPALDAFFDIIAALARAGVTLVAEAALPGKLWQPRLEALTELAEIRILRCTAPTSIVRGRITQRIATNPHRRARSDELLEGIDPDTASEADFDPAIDELPTLTVDTTHGYQPGLVALSRFATRPDPGATLEA
ncbi:AAA family ATPase [Nocardia bhagyanarayanae]|uniref:Putative kinase n=1 Tax=Nocardia bhagyanarayanae TaxID=1215925 RepID=A0A543FFA9_9NOCA|nr:AAA family ATPase [Nocardia bhagyanarayanae]TQM32436.1 putative kinase [Nocardia bhagyanarayanae]